MAAIFLQKWIQLVSSFPNQFVGSENSRPKLSKKSFGSGRFSPCACSLAAEPQRSFSFLFYARCHSDCPSQAMLDACVRAFADVLSMSVTLCSGILLKYLEVFKLPLCSPIME